MAKLRPDEDNTLTSRVTLHCAAAGTAMAIAAGAPPAGRKAEIWALLKLGSPLVLAQASQTLMSLVDIVMAGRLSANDLAGVSIGGGFWFPIFLLSTGILMATSPSVAQLYGARRYRDIGPVAQQAMWLAFVLAALVVTYLNSVGPVMPLLEVAPAVAAISTDYLLYLSFGVPAIICYQVFRYLSDGMSMTKPAMVMGLVGLACKVPLNLLLIYGVGDWAGLGGAGCGLATAIAMWVMLIGLGGYVLWHPRYAPAEFSLRLGAPSWPPIRELLRIGLPIGGAIFVEVFAFSALTLLLAKFGAEAISSHQIALNFSGLLFMVPLSLANATTIRVGQAVGAGSLDGARAAIGAGLVVNTSFALLASVFLLLFAEQIAWLYTSDPEVVAIAATLFLFAAGYQISDALSIGLVGALRGFKDTRVPMLVMVLAHWIIGMPFGVLLGRTSLLVPELGVYGFWIGLLLGLTVAATLLAFRLRWFLQHRAQAAIVAAAA